MITLHDGVGTRDGIFTVDRDHKARTGSQGDAVIGDPWSCTLLGALVLHHGVNGERGRF